ncbi:His Kinase A (phospho-acceptor) domain-containing protein [Fontimonas thermophila]|uniref:histidine kinase n=1 Tax=Fontimonas thermophila TaxID=1076937 RepID=A0A1I2HD50_9GAMM|nr:DAHL domain-containing protein [Fontimonas thermophila]SFF26686.1 His Kinase A (phospho-acceptor) domain-containing protein [Fontimonas thermophila]
MTWRKMLPLFAAVLAVAAIGVLAFLVRKTQTVDNALHLERLKNIRTVDALDVGLNRAVTQVGVSTMVNVADKRAVTTAQLGNALDALENGPAALRGLSPEIDTALDRFLDTIESKFELAFDFEARNILVNQRLIAGLDAVPVAADELVARLGADKAEPARALATQLKTEVTTYGVVQTPVNEDNIRALLEQFEALAAGGPEATQEALHRLRARVNDVIADKNELVRRISDFLARPTAEHLEELEKAYMGWHGQQVAIANEYRLLLAAYAAVLLLVLAWLGIRLRRSYRLLDRANAELARANEHLEEQVQARTRDLSETLKRLQESQAQLIQSEKMASLGQMVAGVAHEINTPLGYARSNAEIVRNALAEIRGLVAAQTRALQLMTSENASDEEVAQALTAAHGIAESIDAEQLTTELDTLLADADHGLQQIAELVASLKDFSRVDRSRTDLFNVNDGIESALKICHNQLKHRIEVIKAYGQLPPIECSPSQLNQVFLNLITNAAQAIADTGRIYIHTAADAEGVTIRILDTGCGMTEEVRARIFEPFFTTKPVGKGTGLGLSIVYRIVEDHGGRIEVRSAPGKGSEFKIRLPLRQNRAGTAAAASGPAVDAALAAA